MNKESFNGNDIADTLLSLYKVITNPSEPVARTELGNIVISTVITSDMGPETAIGDSTSRWFPVQRYETIEKARLGHEAWTKFIEDGHRDIVMLGYMIVPDSNITLQD